MGGLTRNLLGFGCRKTSCIPFFLFCLHPPPHHVPSLSPPRRLAGTGQRLWWAQQKDWPEPHLQLWKLLPLWLFLWGPTRACKGQIQQRSPDSPLQPFWPTVAVSLPLGQIWRLQSCLLCPFHEESPLGFCWAPESWLSVSLRFAKAPARMPVGREVCWGRALYLPDKISRQRRCQYWGPDGLEGHPAQKGNTRLGAPLQIGATLCFPRHRASLPMPFREGCWLLFLSVAPFISLE